MKHLLKVLSLGAAIILSAPFAKADSTNQISFNGFETYCPPTSTTCTAGAVTYASTPVNSLTGGATGIFADFAGAATHFFNFNYVTPSLPIGLFYAQSTINTTESLSFLVTSLSYSYVANQGNTGLPSLDIFGTGNYVFTSGSAATFVRAGSFDMTTQGAGNSVACWFAAAVA